MEVKSRSKIKDADVIIALSFGARKKGWMDEFRQLEDRWWDRQLKRRRYKKYGIPIEKLERFRRIMERDSNLHIARIALRYAREKKIPMIIQKEVGDIFREFFREPGIMRIVVRIIEKHRIEGEYLDTYEVLAQTYEIMQKYGWKKVLLVVHWAHLPRAKKVLEKMGITVVIPSIPEHRWRYKGRLSSIPFDPCSLQWWTRNWFYWIIREIPTHLIYKKRGWI